MKIKTIILLINILLFSGFGATSLQAQTKRILIVVTSHDKLGDTGEKTGFYLSEVIHPHDVFVRAGFIVDFVSPQGGAAPMTAVNLNDPLNKAFIDNPELMKQVKNTLKPQQVEAGKYDAIFYAGGHGTMWDFPDNEPLARIASKIYNRGGVVGAVCHGPSGLVNVKLSNGKYLVEGKTVSAFTNEEEANFT
jgi:putative intracellular protease/amidase